MELSSSGLCDISFINPQLGTAQNSVWYEILGLFPARDKPKQTGEQKEFEPIILSDNEVIEIEKKIYNEKMKKNELEEYEGKYIALLKGEVYDSDTDFSTLAKRVYDKLGYNAVFMTRVIKNEKSHKMSPKFK
jgi:hypothetical protein